MADEVEGAAGLGTEETPAQETAPDSQESTSAQETPSDEDGSVSADEVSRLMELGRNHETRMREYHAEKARLEAQNQLLLDRLTRGDANGKREPEPEIDWNDPVQVRDYWKRTTQEAVKEVLAEKGKEDHAERTRRESTERVNRFLDERKFTAEQRAEFEILTDRMFNPDKFDPEATLEVLAGAVERKTQERKEAAERDRRAAIRAHDESKRRALTRGASSAATSDFAESSTTKPDLSDPKVAEKYELWAAANSDKFLELRKQGKYPVL